MKVKNESEAAQSYPTLSDPMDCSPPGSSVQGIFQARVLEWVAISLQERFNKDLEEIKESQYIMNNAINEIKNTLEATNSRITEAEDRISELEDRMVEINESAQSKYRAHLEHIALVTRVGSTAETQRTPPTRPLLQVEKVTNLSEKRN